MRFAHPHLLLLALPWLLFGLFFAHRQRQACRWIWSRVAERARPRLTLYTRRTLGPWMTLVVGVGLLLVAAAAGPFRSGGQVRELTVRAVLLLDASASMRATDIEVPGTEPEARQDRFEMARAIARELTRRVDGSFALVSFSGEAALQLPLTSDRELQQEALRVVEVHNVYRRTGSSFGTALDRVLPFVDERDSEGDDPEPFDRVDLQAVLLSDGEQPFAEPFGEPLAALAARGIPVHAVAIGSETGESRAIYDFRQVVAGAEEPATLREYTTRRQDEHLRRIAGDTGGRFEIAAPGTDPSEIADALARALQRHQSAALNRHDEGRRDLSALLLAVALLGLLADAFLPRRPKGDPDAFDVGRLGDRRHAGYRRTRGSQASAAPAPVRALGQVGPSLITLSLAALSSAALALAALSLSACVGDDPADLASVENGKGIEADRVLLHGQAQIHYERSRAYRVSPEIPTHNLARSVFLQNDYSAAHDLYQEALELAPELPAAHYNDGHALYRWGVMERDPRSCYLERTLELWQAARERFETALKLYSPQSEGARRSQVNLDFMDERVEEIRQALLKPPPSCSEPPPGDPLGVDAAGGGASQGSSPGSPQDGPPQDTAEATDPEAQPPTSPTAQEGLEQEPLQTGTGGADPRRQEPGPGAAGTTAGPAGRADPSRIPGQAPLTPEELEQITQALERLRSQGREGGKFHRRTRAEQFPSASWKVPDREIWW